MDDFTDGLETTDNTPTLPEETPEPVIEPETTPETEQPSSSFASDLPDTAADQEQTQEQPQEQPEQTSEELEQETEITPQEETGTISYEDLLKALTEQTEEIKAIHELEEKKQEFYTNYQNMGIAFLVGCGLLCGCICTLILANYLRH